MGIINEHRWCRNGECPCPVREYVKRQTQCFSFEDIVGETMEDEEKTITCLINQMEYDVVCRDNGLWCPDNPY